MLWGWCSPVIWEDARLLAELQGWSAALPGAATVLVTALVATGHRAGRHCPCLPGRCELVWLVCGGESPLCPGEAGGSSGTVLGSRTSAGAPTPAVGTPPIPGPAELKGSLASAREQVGSPVPSSSFGDKQGDASPRELRAGVVTVLVPVVQGRAGGGSEVCGSIGLLRAEEPGAGRPRRGAAPGSGEGSRLWGSPGALGGRAEACAVFQGSPCTGTGSASRPCSWTGPRSPRPAWAR